MLKKQIVLFLLIGGAGFLVDAGVFYLSDTILNNFYLAKIASYFCAATFTWFFNRKYTFYSPETSRQNPLLQWLKFLYSQSIGFFVNFSVFSSLVTFSGFFNTNPIAAIAVATVSALIINFLSAKYLVFKSKSSTYAN